MSNRKSPEARAEYVTRRLTERERGNARRTDRNNANTLKGRNTK